jgi:hypothetical protein
MIEAEGPRSSVSGSAKSKRALVRQCGLLLSRVRLAYPRGIGVLLFPMSTSVLCFGYVGPIGRKDREWHPNGVKRTGPLGVSVAGVASLLSNRENVPFRGVLAS